MIGAINHADPDLLRIGMTAPKQEKWTYWHWMNKHALSSFFSWLLTLAGRLENVLFENENQYAWKDSTLAMVAKQGFGRLDQLISLATQMQTYFY